jgi:hypothetical protein
MYKKKTFRPLQMRPLRRPETSESYYSVMRRYIPEEGRSLSSLSPFLFWSLFLVFLIYLLLLSLSLCLVCSACLDTRVVKLVSSSLAVDPMTTWIPVHPIWCRHSCKLGLYCAWRTHMSVSHTAGSSQLIRCHKMWTVGSANARQPLF